MKSIDEIKIRNTKKLLSELKDNLGQNCEKVNHVLLKVFYNLEKLRNQPENINNISTGFKDLDRIINGWQKGSLVIIGARPRMGKVAFMLSLLEKTSVDQNIPSAIFSLEMSSVQLMQRFIFISAEVDCIALYRMLDETEMNKLVSKQSSIAKSNIYIDDTPILNISYFKDKCRKLKSEYNIEFIFIDSLQLMRGDIWGLYHWNKEQEIMYITCELKNLAKELNVVIIVTSEVNKSVEKKSFKQPRISDLSGSKSIEQFADIVMLLYRPEYYGIEEEDGESTRGLAHIIVAKNKNGFLGTLKIQYISMFHKFTDFIPC